MNNELWIEIEGFEGYEVSNQGRVRSWKPQGRGKTAASEPRYLYQYIDPQGYAKVRLFDGASGYKNRYLHRLMAAAFIGPVDGLTVRHLDDNKRNNTLENLAIGTQAENSADCIANGTFCNQKKLTEDDVAQIIRRAESGERLRAVHADFPQVSYATIRSVVNGKTHKKVIAALTGDAA